MTSRKNIWDAMDKMEGKPVGSTHAALEKERVRQGYKPSKSRALRSRMMAPVDAPGSEHKNIKR